MTSMPAEKMPVHIPLRVLIVEDRPADAELMLYELERAGFQPQWRRVETEADYLSQLQTVPDIILADHTLPEFGAPRALELLRASALDIPLIVVTGSISEEVAVARLKQGATDYIIKDRMTRLGDSVERALKEKRLRDQKREAEEALKSRYRELQTLQEVSQIILTAPDIRTVMEKILDKTAALGVVHDSDKGMAVSICEFILEGLCAQKKISRSEDKGTYTATKKSQEPIFQNYDRYKKQYN